MDINSATASLAIQILVLGLLITGYFLKNRKRYSGHGITMATAVVLHVITILTVMVPSFSNFFSIPGSIIIDANLIITLVHVSLGLIAVALGTWLASSWHFKTDLQRCFANKRLMKPTLLLWIIAILLGIYLYLTIWASLL
ncbi:MAG TPA: hypothetical protein VF893_08395 [Candidatus Bathyarchaeia archaeon]